MYGPFGDEPLRYAQLHQRERAAQAEREHLASSVNRPPRPRISLPSLTEIPVGLALQMILLVGLLAGLLAAAAG
jgi:hypothetical protein